MFRHFLAHLSALPLAIAITLAPFSSVTADETPAKPTLDKQVDALWNVTWQRFYLSKTNLFYDYLSSYEPGQELSHLPTASEVRQQIPNECGYDTGMEDCMISAGVLLSLIVDKYAVTKDETLRQQALEVFKGIQLSATAHGVSGFLARGVCADDLKSIYTNSSRDQYTHAVHGLWIYARSPLCSTETKKEIGEILAAIADRMTKNVIPENNYDSLRADGSRDTRGISRMWNVGSHEAARLPMIYAATWDITGRQEYYDLYQKYLKPAIKQSQSIGGGHGTYVYLQVQASLELLAALEKDAQLKKEMHAIMARVAQICESRALSAYKHGQSLDLTMHCTDWRTGEGLSSTGKYRKVWYCIRESGEAALTQLMLDGHTLSKEQQQLLENAINRLDANRVSSCGIFYLQAAYWKAQRQDQTESNKAQADVIVYGSTPGGFCAAIAAAREGASVILLEPTGHVGGLSTGGLSHCDSNQMVRSTLMGLFDEWHTRVVKDYTDRGLPAPYNPAKKDQSRWTFEPHVAKRVTMQMLKQAGVKVLTEQVLTSVTKEGPRITSLVTPKTTFFAKVFVDGSYEGDLMAAADVDWTIGREGRNEYGETLAGKRFPKKKMNINGFDENGKLLPLVTTNDIGDKKKGDRNVMTYSFRLCLTTDQDNRVPIPEPAHYDAARFEIVRRALQAGEKRVGFDLYPLPGGKLDGNNSIGGQFSIGLVGGGNDWHAADALERQEIWEAHKQYTLEFYHFLTTDPVVPASIRNRFTKLGLCKDEFANYDHFSPALYVRESRRMKGLYVISQKDIIDEPEKVDPIAISSFPIDSHDCQRIAIRGGGVVNEGTIFPVRRKGQRVGFSYHVPYRAVLPKREQCNNLLVPVALSCTHVGISSLRIEGTWMVIGQGAGIAAALAADQDIPVQDLAYAKLRQRLLAQKQVLQLPFVTSPDPPSNKN